MPGEVIAVASRLHGSRLEPDTAEITCASDRDASWLRYSVSAAKAVLLARKARSLTIAQPRRHVRVICSATSPAKRKFLRSLELSGQRRSLIPYLKSVGLHESSFLDLF